MASPAGLAHVAAVSFLSARVAPTGAFWLSLAGGASLARESQLRGLRSGYAGSAAAMLQTVAIVGPLRFNAPLTQALTGPLLGAMHARRRSPATQFLACLAIRLVHYALITCLALFVLIGTKAYAGSYHTLFGWLPFLPRGLTGALILTAIGNVAAAIFFSILQVLFCRQALLRWPPLTSSATARVSHPPAEPAPSRTDPRVSLVVAVFITAVLLASHAWPVLAAVGSWLAVVLFMARGADRDIWRMGLLLACLLGLGTLAATLIGGLSGAEAASRGLRAGLLVMVATWLRLAAGSAGLRETFRRILLRLHRLPAAREAGEILSELDSGALLAGSARSVAAHLRGIPARPLPVATAVMRWAAEEAESVPVRSQPARMAELRLRASDAVFAASTLLPAAALSAALWG